MKFSRQGAMELIGHEAIVQTKYRDSVGVWTIGVGHTKKAGKPDPKTYGKVMPIKEVIELFERNVKKYVDDVNAAIKKRVS